MTTKWDLLTEQEQRELTNQRCDLYCAGCETLLETEADFAQHFIIPDTQYRNLGYCPTQKGKEMSFDPLDVAALEAIQVARIACNSAKDTYVQAGGAGIHGRLTDVLVAAASVVLASDVWARHLVDMLDECGEPVQWCIEQIWQHNVVCDQSEES